MRRVTACGPSLTVGSGALAVNQAFTNAGAIQLTALSSALTGNVITSTGTIDGFGSVSNSVSNGAGGTIEAIGEILSLNGPIQNQSGALLTASSGNKLLVTQGLSANAGTINLAGVYLPIAQLVAGLLAIALTIGLHLLLTRTAVGSKLLAVAEDRTAAMLMGIKPDRMQALAWGLSAGAAGVAGALMATAYPWSPSVGETFGLIAFVVVALGGFGSVLGSLYAGLIIGLIQAVSAFWLGAIYKDIVVYGLFVALLWLRPQGLMGKA